MNDLNNRKNLNFLNDITLGNYMTLCRCKKINNYNVNYVDNMFNYSNDDNDLFKKIDYKESKELKGNVFEIFSDLKKY